MKNYKKEEIRFMDLQLVKNLLYLLMI